MSCHVMSCHVMLCLMSCYVMLCHVMSCYVMSIITSNRTEVETEEAWRLGLVRRTFFRQSRAGYWQLPFSEARFYSPSGGRRRPLIERNNEWGNTARKYKGASHFKGFHLFFEMALKRRQLKRIYIRIIKKSRNTNRFGAEKLRNDTTIKKKYAEPKI
jgi:hypothetical protein